MAKKRMYAMEMDRGEGRNPLKGHVMRPNNPGRGPISEDMSRPCGLPMGAIQRDLGNGEYFSMNAFRVGDLYEQVDKNMREDAANMKSQTKPTNW